MLLNISEYTINSQYNLYREVNGSLPIAITLVENGEDGYRIKEFWEAMDGEEYVNSIKE